jgi:hypothetical protein
MLFVSCNLHGTSMAISGFSMHPNLHEQQSIDSLNIFRLMEVGDPPHMDLRNFSFFIDFAANPFISFITASM